MDVVFLLDFSGSVETQYSQMIEFTKRVVYGLDMAFDRTHVGVITFGSEAVIQFNLHQYSDKQEVINAMSFYPNRGRTNTQAALHLMRTQMFEERMGNRAAVPNIAILVTDGHSNVDQHKTVPEAMAAKQQGIDMYVVTMGDHVDMREINQIAGSRHRGPETFVFPVREREETEFVADMLTDWLCW